MTIETENLRLVQCDTDSLKAAISGNEGLARKQNAIVHDHWTEFGQLLCNIHTINRRKMKKSQVGGPISQFISKIID